MNITQQQLQSLAGATIVEFGADSCGYCQGAQALIAAALKPYPAIAHIKIEDGKGQRLGRVCGVKLWPTLLFLKNGIEISRLVRPSDSKTIAAALNAISIA
jgi:thioredoxin 1